jgi:hypothetical protein
MKKFLLFFIILIATSSFIYSDVYIKREVHTESYYEDGLMHPAVDRVIETWIGNKKMAYISNSRIIIVDLNKNLMFFINKNEKTYVEIPLPFELAKVVTKQIAPDLQYSTFSGTVKATKESKTIGRWKCRCYNISGSRPYGREIKAWVHPTPPFDMDTYNKMNINVLKLHNYDSNFIKEMQKIRGIEIRLDETVYFRGSIRKRTDKILEISKKTPKTISYSVPAGYKKKDKLSHQDLEQDNLILFLLYPVKI